MDIVGILLGLTGTIIWGFGTIGLNGKSTALLSVSRYGFDLNKAAELGKQRMATVVGVCTYAVGVLASIAALFSPLNHDVTLTLLSLGGCILIVLVYFLVLAPMAAKRAMFATLQYFYFETDNRASWDQDNNAAGWRERIAKTIGVDSAITKEALEQLIKSY